MSIGDNIRAARIECNMTQAELAEKVGLSQSTIALYEAGKRELTASQIVPFAHVLDTSPLFLLEGTHGGGGSLPLLSSLSSMQKREKFGSESCRPILPPVPNAFVLFYFIYIMGTVCGAYMHRKCDCKPYHKHDCKPLPSTVIHSLVHSLRTAYLQPYPQAREVLT
ncbi:helix-turn-helix domain-containing protein [uncultured Selenomonas sp.]|uniref:helix-turn-helix domain-containing protein n=1 Tax=uncultured Selenomonas sp. TaxID=159275 RepID=UPI0037DC7F0E